MISVVGALAITALAAADTHSLIGLGREALDRMSGFSKVLLPTITAAAAASGSRRGAAVRRIPASCLPSVASGLRRGAVCRAAVCGASGVPDAGRGRAYGERSV